MKPEQPPRRDTLPELPRGCDELQATESSDSEMRLRAHLDCLPGLGIEQANTLSHFATDPTPSASEESVLGLEDLLRTQYSGNHVLHPRILQVISVGVLDSLLETITARLDKQSYYSAYQYPQYLLECRGAAPDQTTLYPPEYYTSAIDVIRDLRANDFLTTVCRPGDTVPDADTLRAAVDSMERRNEHPHGVFTLRASDDYPRLPPILVIRDDIETGRWPEETELFQFLGHLCDTHLATLQVAKASELSGVESDD